MILSDENLIFLHPESYKRILNAVEATSLKCLCGGDILHVKTEEARVVLSKTEFSCKDCGKPY